MPDPRPDREPDLHRDSPQAKPPQEDPPPGNPLDEPIYRAILWVLVASVLVGAVLTLAGEALFGSRALANAGLGMAVVCGALYWVFRLLGRRAARRHGQG